MDRDIWLNKEIDLMKSLKSEQYDYLIDYARDHQQYLMEKWHASDILSFQKSVRFGMSILRYFEKHLQEHSEMKAIFRLGELMGSVENYEHFLYEKMQDAWADQAFKEEVLSIKHLDEIVLALEIHGVMNHSEICECTNLKESTLSEIMKKVDLTKLISCSRSGKYKLYRLTDDGRRLGKQLRKQRNESITEQETLLRLQHFLHSTKNREELKQKVKEILEFDCDAGYETNTISPGDSLTVFYDLLGKVHQENYYVWGIENGRKSSKKNIRIMAEKRKYDIDEISDIYNFKKDE